MENLFVKLNKLSNIVLIGMPGSGKSTIGALLAAMTAKGYVDTDILVQGLARRSLQDIVDREGHMALRHMEETVLLRLDLKNHVIATGGSAVYSRAAMEHLSAQGVIVFLKVGLQTLRSRVTDYGARGLAKRPEQTLEDLFQERFELYARYAHLTIDCDGLTQEGVCVEILRQLGVMRRAG